MRGARTTRAVPCVNGAVAMATSAAISIKPMPIFGNNGWGGSLLGAQSWRDERPRAWQRSDFASFENIGPKSSSFDSSLRRRPLAGQTLAADHLIRRRFFMRQVDPLLVPSMALSDRSR